jgi:hypothetical protein
MTIETLREMRPAEYPLAEPYRVKILAAAADTRLEDYARDMPVEKFEKEQLRLLNAMYPKGEPEPGELFRSCSEARVLPASSPPRALIRRTDHVNFPGGVPRTPGPQGKRQRT